MTKIYKIMLILWSLKKQENRRKLLILLREYMYTTIHQRQQLLEASKTEYKLQIPLYSEILHLGNSQKILLVVHEFSRTGAPYAVLYLARALYSIYGAQPVILSPKDGPLRAEFEEEGFRTIVDPLLFSYQDFAEACNFVAGFERVIVTSLASFYFIRFFRGIAQHLTWWVHETEAGFNAVKNMGADLPLLFATCESIWLGSPLCFPLANRFAPQVKLSLLLYGCEDTATPLQQRYSGKMIFSIFGSVEHRKGQDIFLDAIERLPEKLKSKAIFRIIGSPLPHNESVSFHKKICERAQLIPEVECINNMPLDKLHQFYAETDVFVSASRDDPMPIVITQGLMFSKVCLISSAIGHAKLLEDKREGLIFLNESAESLSEGMGWLLQNAEKLNNIGLAGRTLYERHFLMSNFINKTKNLTQARK